MSPDPEPAPEEDDLLGRTVGKYTLIKLLGVGGMGRVYEGAHESLGKRFALKFIDRASITPEAVMRFQREAQAASAVDSAHIVDIFDVGQSDDGRHFIVMELLRGEDLGHRIRRLGRLDLGESLRIIAHVLRGLARAHEAGIVHRDLKPDNVFLVERDDDPCFAKLLDFGVSKMQKRDSSTQTITREGVVLGTPVYMSPEQAQAMPDVDGRTDLWAAGAILYECLAGRPAQSGPSYEAVIVAICTRDVEDIRVHNPEVPAGVATVLKKALAREKTERYETARDMLDALVAESVGLLPGSLASDSLKRAVIRSSPSQGGPLTLGAVSTVAATPAVTSNTTQAPSTSRAYFAVAAAAIALGGIIAGVWWGRRGPGHSALSQAPQSQVIVLQSNPTATAAEPTAAASVLIEPTARLLLSPSGALSVGAPSAGAPSADVVVSVKPSKKTPIAVRSAAPIATATPREGGIGDGLKLKTQ